MSADYIKRQDVFDLLDNWDSDMVDRRAFYCDVEDIPSVEISEILGIKTVEDS